MILVNWVKLLFKFKVPSSTHLGSSQTSASLQLQQQQQQQAQQAQQTTPSSAASPAAATIVPPTAAPAAAALTSLVSINQSSSFILRKQFNYRSKYNLVNLMRELENTMREFSKADVNASYFTFKRASSSLSSARGRRSSRRREGDDTNEKTDETTSNMENKHKTDYDYDDDDDHEQLFLRDTTSASLSSSSALRSSLFWMHNHPDLHFIDEFDYDVDFANLKRTRFAKLHDAMSRSENLIVTMNAEYTAATTTTATSAPGQQQQLPSACLSQSMTTSTYNRVPSFGSARDKEQQQQNIIRIEYAVFFLFLLLNIKKYSIQVINVIIF